MRSRHRGDHHHSPPPHTAFLLYSTSSSTRVCSGLRWRLACVILAGMDTSTAPLISPVLEPETMTALMLRYCEVHEEAAYQYARALLFHLSSDLAPDEAARLARDIVTEATNDIRDFEGGDAADRIDVAARRLIDRVEAELAD